MTDGVPKETRYLEYPDELFDPKLWLNFVQMPMFEKAWSKIGLDDNDLRALEVAIMVDPKRQAPLQGTGGLRKIRFASDSSNKGKSGGVRVLYAYIEDSGIIILFYVFAKNDMADLHASVKSELKSMLDDIREWLSFK